MVSYIDLPAITANPLFLGIVFILFMLSIKKVKKVVFNALWIALASVLFPIAMNRLGYAIATDANSIVFYLTIGLGAYFAYLFARSVYTILGITEKIASPITSHMKSRTAKKKDDKIDKLLKDKEKERKEEKLLKEREEDKMQKIMKKSEKQKSEKRKGKDDDYVALKETEEKEEDSKNIIRKFREAED